MRCSLLDRISTNYSRLNARQQDSLNDGTEVIKNTQAPKDSLVNRIGFQGRLKTEDETFKTDLLKNVWLAIDFKENRPKSKREGEISGSASSKSSSSKSVRTLKAESQMNQLFLNVGDPRKEGDISLTLSNQNTSEVFHVAKDLQAPPENVSNALRDARKSNITNRIPADPTPTKESQELQTSSLSLQRSTDKDRSEQRSSDMDMSSSKGRSLESRDELGQGSSMTDRSKSKPPGWGLPSASGRLAFQPPGTTADRPRLNKSEKSGESKNTSARTGSVLSFAVNETPAPTSRVNRAERRTAVTDQYQKIFDKAQQEIPSVLKRNLPDKPQPQKKLKGVLEAAKEVTESREASSKRSQISLVTSDGVRRTRFEGKLQEDSHDAPSKTVLDQLHRRRGVRDLNGADLTAPQKAVLLRMAAQHLLRLSLHTENKNVVKRMFNSLLELKKNKRTKLMDDSKNIEKETQPKVAGKINAPISHAQQVNKARQWSKFL